MAPELKVKNDPAATFLQDHLSTDTTFNPVNSRETLPVIDS
jgi:hypothetical protein